jgi:Flp pilus assembly protein CpaB
MSRHARFAVAAGACALIAAWLTFSYAGGAGDRDGPRVDVLVAPAGLKAGASVDAAAAAAMQVREVPARFAPPDALASPEDAIGTRALAGVVPGGYVVRSLLSGGSESRSAYRLRAAERAVTVEVAVSPAGTALSAGDRVDLFASGFGGDQHTDELIAGAEVLTAEDGEGSRTRATLRLAATQVASVIRADVFAHELRAVARPAS